MPTEYQKQRANANKKLKERLSRGRASKVNLSYNSYKKKYIDPKVKTESEAKKYYSNYPKTPPRTSRPGPTPKYSARRGPTPRPKAKTPSPIHENNQGYTNNWHTETPSPKNTRSNYQKALNYFGYVSLNGKTKKNVRKNYLKMSFIKHPNKGGSKENFQLLGKYYKTLNQKYSLVST